MNYLYNGVELPALPEWDKTAYPYAFITRVLGKPILQVSVERPYWDNSDMRFLYDSDGGWAECKNGLWEDFIFMNPAFYTSDEFRPLWSNFDVLNEDGSVYMAASEPIPVGASTFTPDPISLTLGWLVGRRIAGQRKK